MSGRSTTLISYEPANTASDDSDVDTGQLAKLQEKVNIGFGANENCQFCLSYVNLPGLFQN